jgi:hypothetical protein
MSAHPYTRPQVGALALPMALTTAIRVGFGSKWRVALRRAQIAGKLLAASLLQVRGGDGGRVECMVCIETRHMPSLQTRVLAASLLQVRHG